MTRRASNVSHHSTVCTALFSGAGSQPWCRPASVAWRVATSGMPWASLTAVAVCATSQSWPWTTSGCRSSADPQRSAGEAVLERHHPGEQVAHGQCRGVGGDPDDSDPVDDRVGPCPVDRLGDHGHLVAGRGLRLGQCVHMPSQSAVDERRVLPGQDEDAHGELRLSGRALRQEACVQVRERPVGGALPGREPYGCLRRSVDDRRGQRLERGQVVGHPRSRAYCTALSWLTMNAQSLARARSASRASWSSRASPPPAVGAAASRTSSSRRWSRALPSTRSATAAPSQTRQSLPEPHDPAPGRPTGRRAPPRSLRPGS